MTRHVEGELFWRQDGTSFPVEYTATALHEDAAVVGVVVTFRDITERQRVEAATRAQLAQEAVIRSQSELLAELSTPLIPISDEVLILPLIGALDARRAQQVIERLLEGVAANQASVVIVDITGVAVVDTHVASTLLQAAQAVRLLGAEVMLTGIRPEVAQTIVGLGVDLGEIRTHSNLQQGIVYALRQHSARH